jgi:hypothetical protein
VGRIGRVIENGHSMQAWNGFFEELQPFAESLRADREGQAGHISARTAETGDKTEPDRITHIDHDNGCRPGGVPSGDCSRARSCHDHRHIQPHQLCGEFGQPIEVALGKPVLDFDVLPLNMAEVA